MGKKVPNALRKALFKYIEKPEEESVSDLLKSCFPENNKYNKGKRTTIPKSNGETR